MANRIISPTSQEAPEGEDPGSASWKGPQKKRAGEDQKTTAAPPDIEVGAT